MFIRASLYVGIGLMLVVLTGIINTKLGWSIDLAWIIIVALAFAYPAELAPIAGLVFGLVLDGLTGSMGFYTISYSVFGVIFALIRRVFFLEGLVPAWILAVIGAEALWLFFGLFSRALLLIGVAIKFPGLLSPFLLATLIGFPFVYWITKKMLPKPDEMLKGHHFGATTRIIDRT